MSWLSWLSWLFDVFRQSHRREPEMVAGRVLAPDVYLGLFALAITVIAAAESDVAAALCLGAMTLALIGGPILVALRPAAGDRVLVLNGTLLLAAVVYQMVSFVHFLVTEPGAGFRYGPGYCTWLLCLSTLHWVATGTRRTWVRRLPRAALVTGILFELPILALFVSRFASTVADLPW